MSIIYREIVHTAEKHFEAKVKTLIKETMQ